MNRCIIIHPTGATELQDFHPLIHQRLRGLGYKRFVLQLVRSADHRMFSSAVYSRLTPSAWHVSESARKLWGRGAGAISIFDENGDVVEHGPEPTRAKTATSASDASGDPMLGVVAPDDPLGSARERMRAMDAYAAEHRLRSLAHRWLYLVDRNDGNAATMDELFAATFELGWSPAGIRTREELSAWYLGVSKRVLKSSHTLVGFEYDERDDGRYGVRLELQWYGFTREQPGQEQEARTLHEWTVVDDPMDRFARIETAKIRIMVPAQLRRV